MVALRCDQAARTSGNRTYEAHRCASLIEHMSVQYWRVSSRSQILCNIGMCIRQDLRLLPMQCGASIKHLSALRQDAAAAYRFYSTLDPYAMRTVRPNGTIRLLAHLDDQVTELLLLLDAFTPICTESSSIRVQLQLLIRHLYPAMMVTFEATTSQLAALIEKVTEQAEVQA